jgi:hypothetical protein
MTRLCERPGCSQVAELTYGFDADHLMVWIDSFERGMTDRSGVLCRRHADAMVVPLGWMLDDRREAVPRLFKAPAPQASPPRPRRSPTRHQRDDTQQLELVAGLVGDDADDDGVDATVDTVAARHADDEVLPWKPAFDQTDDLDGLLEARGPLLARAFGSRGRGAIR